MRRAWLCGEDDYTGGNFDHRKSWLLARMKALEEVFAVRIAAYAVTGNHYHVVLYLDIEQGRAWDRDEVIGRWTRLFSGDPLARAYLRGGLDGTAPGRPGATGPFPEQNLFEPAISGFPDLISWVS